MKIGEVIPKNGEIVINEGKETVTVIVKHTGDRPVQVGSHFHFFEVNRQLEFDRALAYGTIWIFLQVHPCGLNQVKKKRYS